MAFTRYFGETIINLKINLAFACFFWHYVSSFITRYIKRKNSDQWYINFPSAVAQAMEFQQSEQVEWIVSDKKHLILKREHAPPDPISVKKK